LTNQGCAVVDVPPQRAVNFQKSIARMIFSDDSGSLALQNFTLADGQICIRAQYTWAPSQATSSYSIYPSGEDYDWAGAAVKIAEGWATGMAAAATRVERSLLRSRETASAPGQLAAVG
jgi:hypothetical protein